MTAKIDYKANLKKLIEALESDKYTQGFGVMRYQDDPNCMCIQGIMCDIAVDKGLGDWVPEGFMTKGDLSLVTNFAPPNVRDLFVPLNYEWCSGIKYDELKEFFAWSACRNDQGWSFQMFADELKRINNLPNH